MLLQAHNSQVLGIEMKCENLKDLFKKSQVFKYVIFNGVPGKYFFAAHVK